MNVDTARTISRLAHKGQTYGDQDYFTDHVQAVVDACQSNRHCCTIHTELAYLHDVLEDTDVTLSDMQNMGADQYLVNALLAITRQDGEVYMDYIARCCGNSAAQFVKYHDLTVNIERCRHDLRGPVSGRHATAQVLIGRYLKALEYIRKMNPFWLHESCRFDKVDESEAMDINGDFRK